MKFGVNLIILIFISFELKSQMLECNNACKLVERILQENFLYSSQLDLSFVDTIEILDMTNTFINCKSSFEVTIDSSLYKSFNYEDVIYKTKLSKTVIFKNHDIVPFPLIGTWENNKIYAEKYKNYLIIQRFEEFGNLRLIKLFKVLSNHKISISYKCINGELELVDFEVGQY